MKLSSMFKDKMESSIFQKVNLRLEKDLINMLPQMIKFMPLPANRKVQSIKNFSEYLQQLIKNLMKIAAKNMDKSLLTYNIETAAKQQITFTKIL